MFAENTTTITVGVVSLTFVSTIFLYLFSRPAFPKNAPKLSTEAWPIIGSIQFFTERWSFYERQRAHSKTGNFSFYAGDKPILGISGEYARKIFFENKGLGLTEAYSVLLGGTPQVKKTDSVVKPEDPVDEDNDSDKYFTKRIIALLKGPIIARTTPRLLADVRTRLDQLAAQREFSTDPFDSIYRIVFQLTIRTFASNEIAGSPDLQDKVLKIFEKLESTATPMSIMYNWMPVPAKFQRTYAGAQLYMMFKQLFEERKKQGRREEDAMQFLMDQGDDVFKIVTFVMGALFAGQLNSGINAAWILIYLAKNKIWFDRVREEIDTIASRYCPDKSQPLKERLMHVPASAWEGEFFNIDLCLKDSIRLHAAGTVFRKNISGHEITLNKAGTEVIPADAYVVLHLRDVHNDPEVYKDSEEWDPGRYLPDRAEDKKKEYAWVGWGVARHPCVGMRFAKLEMSIVIAFFLAYFEDLKLVGENGEERVPPTPNKELHSARRPDERVFVKYQLRKD